MAGTNTGTLKKYFLARLRCFHSVFCVQALVRRSKGIKYRQPQDTLSAAIQNL